jgi:hypothetical protein
VKKKAAQSVNRTPANADYREPDIIGEVRQAMRENGVRDCDLPSRVELAAQIRDLRANIAKQRSSPYAKVEYRTEAQQLAQAWRTMQRSHERGISRGGRGM